MKLFQRLLVAPAALGLLAPLTANATEVNLNDISTYSDEGIEVDSNSFKNNSTPNLLLAGGEGLTGDSHDHSSDSFSSTTSASFGVDFIVGSVDGNATSEAVTAFYSYGIGLSTSFTGDDSLDVAIDAGNAVAALNEMDFNTNGDELTVDGITYTFPLGEKLTVLVGDSTSGSALYSTACVYGGFTNTLDDCGNGNSAFGTNSDNSVGFSASYDIGNGFTGAIGYVGSGASAKGLMTNASLDYFGGQISYAADSYGISATYASRETSTTAETVYWGFNGYWTPSESGSMPSISVGYELGDPSTDGAKDTSQTFVGLQWDELGAGTLGVAYGSNGAIAEDATEYGMYEVFYSYPVNDFMTITPAAYVAEGVTDETGIMVKTSFAF